MNSCQKGKRGEREWRDQLREQGFNARRTQQYCGSTGDASDVQCEELPEIHFEVKRVEAGNPYNWVTQAQRDCNGNGKLPIVAHKRNHADWLVVMPASEFFKIIRRSDLIQSNGSNGNGEALR